MNTSRAVLCSPHASSSSPSHPFAHTYKILVASILMIGSPLAQSKNIDGYHLQAESISKRIDDTLQKSFTDESQEKEISGPEMTKMFEGFTPTLTLDPEKNTYCIGYGTDIGKKIKHFPYGDNANDIAERMQFLGLSEAKIRDILQGKEPIEKSLAEELFTLRYFQRKEMLETRYETLFKKKFIDLPPVVQKALIDFSYNMCGDGGILPSPGFPGFPKACEALKEENWATFAHEITDSLYPDQVGPRRAGYWVYEFTQLSEKPLTAMTPDVKEEVKSYKKVQPEMEERIAQILLANR